MWRGFRGDAVASERRSSAAWLLPRTVGAVPCDVAIALAREAIAAAAPQPQPVATRPACHADTNRVLETGASRASDVKRAATSLRKNRQRRRIWKLFLWTANTEARGRLNSAKPHRVVPGWTYHLPYFRFKHWPPPPSRAPDSSDKMHCIARSIESR